MRGQVAFGPGRRTLWGVLLHRPRAWWGVAVSLGVHAALALALLELPPAAMMVPDSGDYDVELEVRGAPTRGDPRQPFGSKADGRAPPLRPGGRRSAQNIDARSRGEGGDSTGAHGVILLMHRADQVTLQDSPLNALGVAQTQRIATSADRATRDSRRATPNPDDQAFLASGSGDHRERRPLADVDARAGARIAPATSRAGATQPSTPLPSGRSLPSGPFAVSVSGTADGSVEGSRTERPGESVPQGGARQSPGEGIVHGRGVQASEAAHVAYGRPPVDRGPAATPAAEVDPRIRDNADAELLAAQMVQSWVEATERSGPEAGAGRGGVGGGGRPGSGGGQGEGGQAVSYGPGAGDFASLDTSDRRYVRWLLEQRRRVTERLSFPRARELAMDQGTTVFRFTVMRNGRLLGQPDLVRSSGFDDFDRAALAAIERSLPFSPLPNDLAPGMNGLRVTMPVQFDNPMVH